MGNFALSSAGLIPAMQLAGLAAILVSAVGSRRDVSPCGSAATRASAKEGAAWPSTATGGWATAPSPTAKRTPSYYNYSIRGVEYATAQDISTSARVSARESRPAGRAGHVEVFSQQSGQFHPAMRGMVRIAPARAERPRRRLPRGRGRRRHSRPSGNL